MEYSKVFQKLTGKYYFKKRLLGGYNIMVEEGFNYECPYTCDISPRIYRWRKAKDKDLVKLNLK